MPKGIDGHEYDESWDGDDDSLESYVRKWVEESSGGGTQDLVHHSLSRFPIVVADAIEIIHTMVEVPAWTKDGNKRDRPPSRTEIKIAMVKCGLHHLTKNRPSVSIPSRTERLVSGDVVATLKRNVDWSRSRMPSLLYFQFHNCNVPRDTSEIIQDLADSLSLPNTSTMIACYISALANSREWLVPSHTFRGDWVSQCQKATEWFWELVGSKWGLT